MPKIVLKDGSEFIVDQAILEDNILPAKSDEMIQLGKNFFKKSSIEMILEDNTNSIAPKSTTKVFASGASRILAFILDFIFAVIYLLIILVIILSLGDLTQNQLLLDFINTSGSEYDFVYSLISVSYFVFSFIFFGNTLGGNILKIKVVNMNGENSSATKLAIRSFFIGFPIGLGFIGVFFSKKNQAVHDHMFNTLVVNKNSDYQKVLHGNKENKHKSLRLTR